MLADFEDDPEVAQVMASLLIDTDAEKAYGHAQTAAIGGVDVGALLNRIEDRLEVGQVLSLQEGSKAQPDDADLVSVAAMRNRALALEDGVGIARSYERAYLFASLAAATGDLASAQVLDRIDAHFDARGPQEWAPRRSEVQKRALEIWLDADLAARLSVGASGVQ